MLVTSIFFLFLQCFQKPSIPGLWLGIGWLKVNPFSKQQILDSSKLKEFAGDNIRLDENGWKFLKWIENTVVKGEIAYNKQFLLFPQCFQKACTADTYQVCLEKS